MKKCLSIILALFMIFTTVAMVACGKKDGSSDGKSDGDGKNSGATEIGSTFDSDFGYFTLKIPSSYTLLTEQNDFTVIKTYANSSNGSSINISVYEYEKLDDETDAQALHRGMYDSATELEALIRDSSAMLGVPDVGLATANVEQFSTDRYMITYHYDITGSITLYGTIYMRNIRVGDGKYACVSISVGEDTASRSIANYIIGQLK